MIPRITSLPEKQLIGIRMEMSLSNNLTADLWQQFMSRRKEITHPIGTDLYSIQIYDEAYFTAFNPNAKFEKWAAIEVDNQKITPEGMEALVLKSGLYAVFLYQGPASEGSAFFRYIYSEWLPGSEYQLDNRPHFEILGEKYKNEDPESEEEIWIPVKPK